MSKQTFKEHTVIHFRRKYNLFLDHFYKYLEGFKAIETHRRLMAESMRGLTDLLLNELDDGVD